MHTRRRRVTFRPQLDLNARRGTSARPGELDPGQPKNLPRPDVPRVEVDFRQLEDGRVIELVEDFADATKTKLAVFKNGKTYLADQINYRGQLLVPMARQNEGLQELRLPRALMPYPSVGQLLWWVRDFIALCVSLPDIYNFVVSCWVLYSCFADRLPIAVYLMLTGPPQSGKTTLLETLQLLCRRSLLVADISPAAALEACTCYGATLLIDETDWKRDRRLMKHLRAGTTKGVGARRMGGTRHSFGAKVLTALEPPDEPQLNSRSVHVPMEETDRTDLLKPWDPQVLRKADSLRAALLQFRLERYASICPKPVPGEEKLRPRARDLLASLAAPIQEYPDFLNLLVMFFSVYHDPATRNLLSPEQSAVLAGLFLAIHTLDHTHLPLVGTLAKLVNELLHDSGEKFSLSPRKVGDLMTGLGFGARGRTSDGKYIWLDSETRSRVHALMRRHGSHYLDAELVRQLTANCPLCQEEAVGGPKASTSTA